MYNKEGADAKGVGTPYGERTIPTWTVCAPHHILWGLRAHCGVAVEGITLDRKQGCYCNMNIALMTEEKFKEKA